MIIDRDKTMKYWETADRTVLLANADAYYTKGQVDELLRKLKEEIINRYENN